MPDNYEPINELFRSVYGSAIRDIVLNDNGYISQIARLHRELAIFGTGILKIQIEEPKKRKPHLPKWML